MKKEITFSFTEVREIVERFVAYKEEVDYYDLDSKWDTPEIERTDPYLPCITVELPEEEVEDVEHEEDENWAKECDVEIEEEAEEDHEVGDTPVPLIFDKCEACSTEGSMEQFEDPVGRGTYFK
jgi:hypothetical protein